MTFKWLLPMLGLFLAPSNASPTLPYPGGNESKDGFTAVIIDGKNGYKRYSIGSDDNGEQRGGFAKSFSGKNWGVGIAYGKGFAYGAGFGSSEGKSGEGVAFSGVPGSSFVYERSRGAEDGQSNRQGGLRVGHEAGQDRSASRQNWGAGLGHVEGVGYGEGSGGGQGNLAKGVALAGRRGPVLGQGSRQGGVPEREQEGGFTKTFSGKNWGIGISYGDGFAYGAGYGGGAREEGEGVAIAGRPGSDSEIGGGSRFMNGRKGRPEGGQVAGLVGAQGRDRGDERVRVLNDGLHQKIYKPQEKYLLK